MPVVKPPTDEEIIKWAYGNDETEPRMEFTVLISTLGKADLLFGLAMDKKCFNRDFFLNCLYWLSGQMVRMQMVKESAPVFERLFALVEKSDDLRLKRWMERSKYLFKNPDTYLGQY